ncbi:putative C-type lectin domain family 20 member A isoform 2-T2 [Spinachia spinachia]
MSMPSSVNVLHVPQHQTISKVHHVCRRSTDCDLKSTLPLTDWNTSLCLQGQYHYVADLKTWDEARRHCRETYKDLVSVENTEDVNQLVTTVSSLGYNREVWIGLYSVIDWRWSDGNNGSGWEYRNWENILNNEPDFASFVQFCVNVGDNGRWCDDNCELRYSFICYRGEGAARNIMILKKIPQVNVLISSQTAGEQLDPEYVFVNLKMSWSDAQTYCRERFIDLATVRNETENRKIQSLVPVGSLLWIGLFRNPNNYWSSGSNFSFSYWYAGSTAVVLMTKMCGFAALQSSGRWRLNSCTDRFPFVCYDIPVMRRIVKLKIKPQVPSWTLNDPAVKANILKMDRLKKKGVREVTLSWRQQPDGKVFHQEGRRSRMKPGPEPQL